MSTSGNVNTVEQIAEISALWVFFQRPHLGILINYLIQKLQTLCWWLRLAKAVLLLEKKPSQKLRTLQILSLRILSLSFSAALVSKLLKYNSNC